MWWGKDSSISPYLNFHTYFKGKFRFLAGSGSYRPKCENAHGYGRGALQRKNSLYVFVLLTSRSEPSFRGLWFYKAAIPSLTLLMPLSQNFSNKYTIFKFCKPLTGVSSREHFKSNLLTYYCTSTDYTEMGTIC